MRKTERSDELRELGLTPTIQRLAVLQSLENTRQHPTADQVLVSVRKKFPSISRATVYNTLEALTKASIIQRITVDPAVARYDADIGPHAHFRCRVCTRVYDIAMDQDVTLDEYVDSHHIEVVLTYAYGVCEKCLTVEKTSSVETSDSVELSKRQKTPEEPYANYASANTAPRETRAFSNEPTKNTGDSPANTAQRKRPAFSDEPTKNTEEKLQTATSPSDSPSEEGGESPDARTS